MALNVMAMTVEGPRPTFRAALLGERDSVILPGVLGDRVGLFLLTCQEPGTGDLHFAPTVLPAVLKPNWDPAPTLVDELIEDGALHEHRYEEGEGVIAKYLAAGGIYGKIQAFNNGDRDSKPRPEALLVSN